MDGRDIAARFWAWVDSSGGPDAHHPWTGYRDDQGYGIWSVWDPETQRVRKHRAHRYAWTLVHGPPPADVYVLHKPGCEYPPCCNLDHLYRGDAAANAADRDRPRRRHELHVARVAAAGQLTFNLDAAADWIEAGEWTSR